MIAPVGRLATPSDVVVVSVRRNGRENLLGRYPLSSGGLIDVPRSGGVSPVLRLSETDLLIKTVTLPLAAERDLGQVLAFEMDRETPFSAAEVFWTHRVIDRDHERGRISVQLYLIPRARLRSLLDALGSAGIAVKRAEVADGPTETIDLPLDNDDRAQATANRNLLRWPAVALCAGLAIAVIVTPFARQASTEGALDEAIARGRSAATEAEKIRNEIQNLSGSAELVNSERDKAGRPLAVVAAVTQMLPADTYLTEFRQQQQKVSISGRSGGASRLIAALSASDRLRNPAFAAPVTRIDAIRAEVFTITAEVVP
ncbi:MAG: PilN domain-containing protein [Alphaproteobacteria bacterium]|nr:PilN domain-containing protein [Alphaproteobacteria bacterium]